MKSSTMMAIAFCGLLACAVTGCKYDDDPLNGDVAVGTDLGNEAEGNALTDDNMAAGGQDVATAEDPNANANLANAAATDLGEIKGEKEGEFATGLPFDQDPNYVRCTDVDFAPVYFGFDASNLQQSEMAKIEAVAAHLKKTGRVVIVEGNCDERGSNEYNLSLGQLRAIAIRDYLVQLGVNVQSVQDKSYGEEKPAVVGSNEAAWSKNRRGEFAVYAHK